MAHCRHAHAKALCFECFRAGMDRTRARREAYAQRALPFDAAEAPKGRPLSDRAVAHRRQMLAHLAGIAEKRA
jgi:hypothetical protein